MNEEKKSKDNSGCWGCISVILFFIIIGFIIFPKDCGGCARGIVNNFKEGYNEIDATGGR